MNAVLFVDVTVGFSFSSYHFGKSKSFIKRIFYNSLLKDYNYEVGLSGVKGIQNSISNNTYYSVEEIIFRNKFGYLDLGYSD